MQRPRDNRVIAGVVSGIGRLYGIDTSILRIAVVFLALTYGAGIIAYLIAWAIIPSD